MATANTPMQSVLPGLGDVGLDTRGFRAISYEQLFNVGNYENIRVGCAVDILPDETPADALARAQAWVAANAPKKVK